MRGAVSLLALAAVAGCASSDEGPRSGDVWDRPTLRARAAEFWETRETPPPSPPGRPPRLAVVDFSLQYAADTPSTDYGAGLRLELPLLVYMRFAEVAVEFRRELLPMPKVFLNTTYPALKGARFSDVAFVRDSPEVERAKWYPAEGLAALEPGAANDAILRDLIREIGADAALQVRLRVGVRDGHASIEPGSTFRVVTPAGAGFLESRQPLISDEFVVERAQGRISVYSEAFAAALKRLFRPYIAMALLASGREL